MKGIEEYLLDNQQAEAGQSFDALSELFNPWSQPGDGNR